MVMELVLTVTVWIIFFEIFGPLFTEIEASAFYRPQTKLREGNVFTRVYLFNGWGGG